MNLGLPFGDNGNQAAGEQIAQASDGGIKTDTSL
jgi:hypothetical protein